MIDLMREHPWMAFTLLVLMILAIDNIVTGFWKMLAHLDDDTEPSNK
jgi:hypothetical protein